METLTCKNCGEESEGNYCNNCGQKRIDRHGFYEIRNYIGDAFELKRGFLKTIIGLLYKPAPVVEDYISGKTKSYQNPISLFLTIAALSILVNTVIKEEGLNDILHYSLLIILTLVNTLMIKWFFTKSTINFYERLIFSLYMMTIFTIFTTVLEIIKELLPGELNPFVEGGVIFFIVAFISVRICVPYYRDHKFVWIKSLLLGSTELIISMVILGLLFFLNDLWGINILPSLD